MGKKRIAVLARLTFTYKAGHKLVVEVAENPEYYHFYQWYRVEKNGRGKRWLRGESRDLKTPDLEAVRERTLRIHGARIASSKLVIYKKRAYRHACQRPATELAGGLVTVSVPEALRHNYQPGKYAARVPVQGYTPLAKRFKILTGQV